MSDTKEKLLEIASSLIRQKGINGMSYQHLSDKIGIRKASIHYHFPKKDDLIEVKRIIISFIFPSQIPKIHPSLN